MLPDQRPTTWTFHTAWAVYDTRPGYIVLDDCNRTTSVVCGT